MALMASARKNTTTVKIGNGDYLWQPSVTAGTPVSAGGMGTGSAGWGSVAVRTGIRFLSRAVRSPH